MRTLNKIGIFFTSSTKKCFGIGFRARRRANWIKISINLAELVDHAKKEESEEKRGISFQWIRDVCKYAFQNALMFAIMVLDNLYWAFIQCFGILFSWKPEAGNPIAFDDKNRLKVEGKTAFFLEF